MIEIWGKPQCSFCEKAKSVCEMRGFKYVYKSLDKDFTREELIETFPNARTFPQIVVNGTKIGGYNELINYIEETGYTGTGHSL